jgi:hypothetical protein
MSYEIYDKCHIDF